jgi:endonuclease/exonuclease/phosphatase family metal-dependent hydrolase
MKIIKVLKWIGISIAGLLIAFLAFVWFGTYHPADVEPMSVTCPPSAPTLQAGQSLKIMTWNVQFMAGKNYTFWFDVPNSDGPDERPSPEDITQTLSEVARVIKDEDPDIIMLDEVDNGAARTDYEDQLARLKELLPDDYPCSTSAYYWKAIYVPHPRIHGKAGLTLVVLSKYKIASADRYQLALAPNSWIRQQFNTKRAMLAAHLPIQQGGEFVDIATHLDAFAQGSNTMELEVGQVDQLLADLTRVHAPFIIGGDFNLLPPDDNSFERLPAAHQGYYNTQSEIKPLYEAYQAIPSLADVTSPDFAKWYTYIPNDPAIPFPDSTLDYFFLPKSITVTDHYVRQDDTQKISDHFPVIAVIQLP